MEKGNVLVLGDSGVGKSTLINAVLGEEKAYTGWGTEGTTKELKICERDDFPFRLIDTVGFEPSNRQRNKAIASVQKWSKNQAKSGNEDYAINAIWFCVPGTSSKIFSQTIESLSKAISIWKTVPVIAVITKSYSTVEREKCIELVHNAFAKQKNILLILEKLFQLWLIHFISMIVHLHHRKVFLS